MNDARRCFEQSGIAQTVRASGGTVILPEQRRFRDVNLRGETLGVWPVFLPFLEADKILNVPATKHHSLTVKNWYGILRGTRPSAPAHSREPCRRASFLQPTLTIVDAWLVLDRNGLSGGSLSDVELRKTVLAGINESRPDRC